METRAASKVGARGEGVGQEGARDRCVSTQLPEALGSVMGADWTWAH